MRHLAVLVLFVVSFSQLQAQSEEKPEYYIFSIYFGGGSHYITPEQGRELNEWLESIPGLEEHLISIHGHTDNIGSYEYNQWLSQMRCGSARERLLFKGVRPEQISIEDFGELNPIYDNATWEGKLKNRRVDIIIKPVII